MLTQLLQSDYQIFTAENATDGLQILEKNDVHVVISDHRMPTYTGVEFLEQVMVLKPETIRIMLTGFSDFEVMIDAINRGHIYKYLTKPWNADLFKMEIKDACRIYNLQEKNQKLTEELRQYTTTLENKVSERTLALKNSNERFQTLIESIPDWVWELDCTYQFKYSSKQSLETIGYLPAELLGKCPLDFLFSPEEALIFKKVLDLAPRNRKNISYALLQARDKSGEPRYLESNIQIRRDAGGQIMGYIGISRDVTDRKQFQQALIQHEQELALLLEASNFITTLHDQELLLQSILKGATLAVNSDSGCLFLFDETRQSFSIGATAGFSDSALVALYQYLSRLTLNDSKGIVGIVGKSRAILSIGDVQKDPRWLNFDAAIQSAMWLPIIYEEKLLGVLNLFSHTNEKFTRASIRIGKLFANKVAVALENRQLYNQIQQSEARYRLLVENASDIVVRVEADGHFSFVNSQFVKLMGFSAEEAYVLKFYQVVFPENRALVLENFQRRFAGKSVPDNFEFKIITRQNQTLHIDATFTSLFEGNRVRAIQGILRDVTEKKQVEDAIRRYEEQFRAILENLTEIVYALDGRGQVTFISPAIEKIVNVPASHFIGKTIWENFNPLVHDRQLFERWREKYRQEILLGRREIAFELDVKTGEKVRTIEFSEFFKYNLNDSQISIINGVMHDITERKLAESNLRQTLEGIIGAISLMIEHRDPYTAGHQRNTAKLATAIAQKLALGENQIEGLGLAAILLDVGKISIPAEILNKTASLSEAEMSIIETHVNLGANILEKVPWPWDIVRFVKEHHERLDGSGYPNRLRNDEICLESRILMVADTIDAMINHRPYRPAFEIDEVISDFLPEQKSRFDTEVIDAVNTLYQNHFFESLTNNMFDTLIQ
jgi:PAS domain S-box-containing protein